MFSPPEQEMLVSVHPDGTVSFTVLVPSWEEVKSKGEDSWPVPPEVVMLKLELTPEPDPVKPNVPLPPVVFLITFRDAWLVLVNVQTTASPVASVTDWFVPGVYADPFLVQA